MSLQKERVNSDDNLSLTETEKIRFIYRCIENGFTVKKVDEEENSYEFSKNIEGDRDSAKL
jgi:hypothetical protein